MNYIDDARKLLYKVLAKMCRIQQLSITIIPGKTTCKATLKGTVLSLTMGRLDPGYLDICVESLIEYSTSRHIQLLNTVLSLLVWVLGTIVFIGAEAGLIVSVAAIIIGATSWLQSKRNRKRLDQLAMARRLDGINSRLYEDIIELLKTYIASAEQKCRNKQSCKTRLPENNRLRCQQFLARYPYLE